jgi:hypothetical protein
MTRYRLPTGVLIQEVASEMVLLDVASGRYFELNTMGAVMLRRLQEYGESSRVLQQIQAEYDVSRGDLEKDFGELLEQLLRQGLIEEAAEIH